MTTELTQLDLSPEQRAMLPLGFQTLFTKPAATAEQMRECTLESQRYQSRTFMVLGSSKAISKISEK